MHWRVMAPHLPDVNDASTAPFSLHDVGSLSREHERCARVHLRTVTQRVGAAFVRVPVPTTTHTTTAQHVR